MSSLLWNLIKLELCEFLYMAKSANVNVNFSFGTNKTHIIFEGFNDKKFKNIFIKENNFLKNLNEIKTGTDISLYNELLSMEHLKTKLEIDLQYKLNDSTEIINKINGEYISNLDLTINKGNYDKKILENILLYNIKSLELSSNNKSNGCFLNIFDIFGANLNIEKLFIYCSIKEEIDYSFLKYLPKLKELHINGITIKNKNNLNCLFKKLNEYNKNLEI